MIIQFTD